MGWEIVYKLENVSKRQELGVQICANIWRRQMLMPSFCQRCKVPIGTEKILYIKKFFYVKKTD